MGGGHVLSSRNLKCSSWLWPQAWGQGRAAHLLRRTSGELGRVSGAGVGVSVTALSEAACSTPLAACAPPRAPWPGLAAAHL